MALEDKTCQGPGQFSPRRGSEGSGLGSSCSDPRGEAQEGWPGPGVAWMRDGLGLSLATKPPLRPPLRGAWAGSRAELSPLQPHCWLTLHHSVFPTKNASLCSLPQPLAALPRARAAPCQGSPQQPPVLLPPLLLLHCSHSSVTAQRVSGKLGRFPAPLLH